MAHRTVINPALDGWLDELGWRTVSAVAADVRDDARLHAPRDTGDGAGSYLIRRSGKLSARVGSHLDYMTYVELGSRAHAIRARNRKALRWFANGRPVFRREVWHPGAAAQPHLRPALYTRRVLRRVAL